MKRTHSEDMLMHACCGPCSLEPVRILRERGIEPHIFYANSNIAPPEEYEHRLQVLEEFAEAEGLELIEGEYDANAWEETVGRVGDALRESGETDTRARCRACYRMRLEESARIAKERGFTALGTTLSVSPYQHLDLIEEELERACGIYGIEPVFEDYTPHYREATERSRSMGMYRQNYCGCRFSDEEATLEREERAKERQERKAERARAREVLEREQQARKAERAEYDSKQARKRAILKALREEAKAGTEDER